MPIHRIIFRLDFRVNFNIMNNPGKVLEVIDKAQKSFWSKFQVSSSQYTLSAFFETKNKDLFRKINIEPSAVTLELETVAGVKLDKIEIDDSYKQMLMIISKICKEYQIEKIQRAGFRLLYCDKIGNEEDSIKLFCKMFDKGITSGIEKVLGDIVDYGMSFDGHGSDKIHYHIHSGPYFPDEIRKYFKVISEEFNKNNYNMICDLDLYENDFSLKNILVSNWLNPLYIKSQNIIDFIKSQLIKTGGNK